MKENEPEHGAQRALFNDLRILLETKTNILRKAEQGLGDVEDTLLYGKSGAIPSNSEDSFEDDSGNVSYALFPESGLSIGRFPDGVDSNDNGADFKSNMIPSPGADNFDPGSDSDTGDGTAPQKGCSKSSEPPVDGEPSKCSYVSGSRSLLWVVFSVLLLRRRETTL